jgi:hypothetical protein
LNGGTPCPSLKQLKIEGVYLDGELSDKMSHCFENRSENGAKLERLELVSCHNVNPSKIYEWKKFVKTVEVKSDVFAREQR